MGLIGFVLAAAVSGWGITCHDWNPKGNFWIPLRNTTITEPSGKVVHIARCGYLSLSEISTTREALAVSSALAAKCGPAEQATVEDMAAMRAYCKAPSNKRLR